MSGVESEPVVHTIKPIIKTISIIETDILDTLDMMVLGMTNFEEGTGIRRGCQENCPCRLRINCNYYNTLTDVKRWKKIRGDEKKFLAGVWEYYITIFKITFEMSESNMNG